MIKTPLSIALGGAFWTPGATILGSSSQNLTQVIKSIFAVGGQGFAYDPNDLTTMWQDAAKLLPVTGEGQPVWHILDKSGNNNHAFATSSATRPILQRNATTGAYYLAFDGADDFLKTNNIDFTATDKVSLFAGLRLLSDSASILLETSTNTGTLANTGSFNLITGLNVSVTGYTSGSRGSGSLVASGIAKSYTFVSPDNAVITSTHDILASLSTIRRNGIAGQNGTTSKGTGNFGNYPLFIGRRAGTSSPFNGRLYSLIGIGRLTTDSETIELEKAIAKNTGVTLNA